MGNSRLPPSPAAKRSVHPHVHGELRILHTGLESHVGSSPRAWGTLRECRAPGRLDRFIPTCMGNSQRRCCWRRYRPVHPHVHGELVLAVDLAPPEEGSSPRAWGTRGPDRITLGVGRFIPTCMGNSGRDDDPGGRVSVHPHVHGELCTAAYPHTPAAGSSPRAWGTQAGAGDGQACGRFIPTCMGNSREARPLTSIHSVHPHVHGELAIDYGTSNPTVGSSPRAWGTLRPDPRRRVPGRFIPTCMGNSRNRR